MNTTPIRAANAVASRSSMRRSGGMARPQKAGRVPTSIPPENGAIRYAVPTVAVILCLGSATTSRAQPQIFIGPGMALAGQGGQKADWDLEEVLSLAEEKLEDMYRTRHKSVLQRALLRVERVDLICKLTPSQRRKLEVAAKGVATKKLAWQQQMAMQNVQRIIERYYQMGQPKSVAMQIIEQYRRGRVQLGGMTPSSGASYDQFWKRAVQRTLRPEQLAQYRVAEASYRNGLRDRLVDLILAWTQRQLQLTDEQVDRLRPLVQTKIAGTYWFQQFTNEDPPHFYFGIQPIEVLSVLPKSKLKTILADAQWDVYRDLIRRGQRNGGLGNIVVAVEDEEDANEENDEAKKKQQEKGAKEKNKPGKKDKEGSKARENGKAKAAKAAGKSRRAVPRESKEAPSDDPFG